MFTKRILLFIFLCLSFYTQAQTFESVMRKAYSILTIAQERDRQSAEKLEEIKNRRIRLEEELIDALEANQLPKKEKSEKEQIIKYLKKEEAEATKKRKNAEEYLSQVVAMVKGDAKKRQKFVAEYEKKNGVLPDETPVNTEGEVTSAPTENTKPVESVSETTTTTENVENPPTSEEAAVSETPKDGKKKKKDTAKEPKQPKKPSKKDNKAVLTDGKKTIVPYDPQKDVILNPTSEPCELAFDGIDDFSKKTKRETKPKILFKHTEDFMRAAMQDKEYITCEVSASKVQGGSYFIHLTFYIQSREAQRAFGFLDRSSPIIFKLINGRNLTFYNSKTDIGVLENNVTTYKSQLQITSSDAKLLSVVELDVLRVAWSAGYEDYNIYNMDLIQNLFKCLDAEMK